MSNYESIKITLKIQAHGILKSRAAGTHTKTLKADKSAKSIPKTIANGIEIINEKNL